MYALLYKKHLEGLDADEARLLDAWLGESEENRRAEAEVIALLRASAVEVPPVDVPAELSALKARLRAEGALVPQVAIRRPLRAWIWAVAASIALLLGAVYWLRQDNNAAETWAIVSSGEQRNQLVTLPDGSKVWLNRQSVLSYPNDFERATERTVKLEGEAFFMVTENPAQPFVVQTESCQVRVLGTSFNVRALSSDTFCEVEVKTGRVRVSASNQNTELTAGGRAIFDKTRQKLSAMMAALDTTYVADWRNEVILFKKLPLGEAVKRLGHRFDTNIQLENPQLTACPYSANFPQANLDVVLANIRDNFKMTTVRTPNGWLLRGGKCLQ